MSTLIAVVFGLAVSNFGVAWIGNGDYKSAIRCTIMQAVAAFALYVAQRISSGFKDRA